MTTNYACNLDMALKKTWKNRQMCFIYICQENQVRHMFNKFFDEHIEDFEKFYKLIKNNKFTTAILQQYFIWYMDEYEKIYDEDNLVNLNLCKK